MFREQRRALTAYLKIFIKEIENFSRPFFDQSNGTLNCLTMKIYILSYPRPTGLSFFEILLRLSYYSSEAMCGYIVWRRVTIDEDKRLMAFLLIHVFTIR